MKRFAVILIFSAVFSGVWSLPPAFGQQSMTSPVIFVAEAKYEFSPTLEGKPLSYDFIVENKGDAPLTIEKVASSCGCTAAYFDPLIPVGGSGRVTVTVDTTGYGGTTLEQTVEVFSNDPARPMTPLTVKGDVLEFAKISKRIVQLKGKPGTDIKETITIEPVQPFTISAVTAQPGKHIKVSLKDMTDGTRRYQLIVENTATLPVRYFEKIEVQTDSKARPTIIIPVQGQIGGES
jgi:hypothetical protein